MCIQLLNHPQIQIRLYLLIDLQNICILEMLDLVVAGW